MPVITANILGPSPGMPGIGNQLFQIAAALSYSKDHGHRATFPCLKQLEYGDYVSNFLSSLCTEECSGPFAYFSEPSFEHTEIPFTKDSVCIHNSYLQSEKYFVHNRDYILQNFKLPKDREEYLVSKYGDLSEYTSLHIRRGDYLKNPNYHTNLTSTDYYDRALDYLKPKQLLVFSDDTEWAKEHFSNSIVVEEQEDYLEIFLMSFCKDNIIANSSFSWWGAWLNTNPNKTVIAPSNWFGPECGASTKDLVPESWIVI